MDTIWFYLIACIPVLVAGILFALKKQVTWGEWLAQSLVGFVLAGLFHWLAVDGATKDIETWSGQITDGRHYARWQEYYEYAVYRTESMTTTDSKGNTTTVYYQVFDHWEPTQRWHDDEYHLASNIGTEHYVSRSFWYELAGKFGGYRAVGGERTTFEHNSHMIGGDPNDYITTNKTGWIQPITKLVRFVNKIKATPTVFSYAKVPDGIKVFPYPANSDAFSSDRLLGTAAAIGTLPFDQMNARLGPRQKVNVIMVGFGDKGSMMGAWQEAAWIGGKKNDVVICFGGPNKKPDWVRAFGWTDKKVCLRTLESIVLDNGAMPTTLPLIEQEIVKDYVLKDWDRAFAHIRVPAPMWAIWTYLAVAIVAHFGITYWTTHNEIKPWPYRTSYPRY